MKTITFPADEAAEMKKMLSELIGGAPERGYSVEDVRTSLKIIDVIAASGDTVALEDAHHAFVKARVSEARWRVATPMVVRFSDCIENASS